MSDKAEVRPTEDITTRLDNLAQSLAGEYPPHTLMDLAEAASLIATLRSQLSGITEETSSGDDGKAGDGGEDAMDASEMLAWFRSRGWMVAVHNDYRQHDRLYTFWLLTHPNGRWVKGEGVSDALALYSAMDVAAILGSHP